MKTIVRRGLFAAFLVPVKRLLAFGALALVWTGVPRAFADYDCAAYFVCIANQTCISVPVTGLQIQSDGNGNGALIGFLNDSVFDAENPLVNCSFSGQFPDPGTYIIDLPSGLMESSVGNKDEFGNYRVLGTGKYFDPANGYVPVPPPAPPAPQTLSAAPTWTPPHSSESATSPSSEANQNALAENSQNPTEAAANTCDPQNPDARDAQGNLCVPSLQNSAPVSNAAPMVAGSETNPAVEFAQQQQQVLQEQQYMQQQLPNENPAAALAQPAQNPELAAQPAAIAEPIPAPAAEQAPVMQPEAPAASAQTAPASPVSTDAVVAQLEPAAN